MSLGNLYIGNVENIDRSVPGFGSVIQVPRSCVKVNKIFNIALSVFALLAMTGTAVAVGAIVGLTCTVAPLVAVGVGVGSLIILISTAAMIRLIYHKISNRQSYYKLDREFIEANQSNAPPLGKTCEADLKVLNKVDQSFEQKKALVRSAKQSIECSFNFAGGERLLEFLGIIEERMNEYKDLKVHLIMSNDLLEKEDYRVLEELSKRWPERFHYLITDRQTKLTPFIRTEENHVKLLIVDGRYFGLGGSGIQENMTREKPPVDEGTKKRTFAENFIDRSFRDTDLFGRSNPVDEANIAETMRGQFYNLYRIWAKRMGKKLGKDEGFKCKVKAEEASCPSFDDDTQVVKGQKIKFFVGGPEHKGGNPIEAELSKLILGAKKTVSIGNLMFNPGRKITNALLKVKKSNQKVRLIGHFNGKGPKSSFVHYVHVWPSRPSYRLLDTVYESQVEKQHYHKKVMTVDDKRSFIGSYNFGQKSSLCDYEVGCVIKSEEITKRINEALDEDKVHSIEINTGPNWNGYTKTMGMFTRSFLGNLAG